MVLTVQGGIHRDRGPEVVPLPLGEPVCRVDVRERGPLGLLLHGDDGLARRPPGRPVLDAALLVEGGRRPPTQPVAGVRVREERDPGAEGGVEGRAEVGVDALELVADRDLERFDVLDPVVGVEQRGLDGVVKGAPVLARARLHHVTDEDDR